LSFCFFFFFFWATLCVFRTRLVTRTPEGRWRMGYGSAKYDDPYRFRVLSDNNDWNIICV